MLPDSRSGKIKTLARPATGEPGALLAPTRRRGRRPLRSSPSIASSGWRALAILKASRTFSIWGCAAEPLVENESRATRGSVSRKARAFSAVASAISASSCAVGSGTTAQSAKSSAPFSPKAARLRSGANVRKKLDTTRASGARPIECRAARTVSEVEFAAPPTVSRHHLPRH